MQNAFWFPVSYILWLINIITQWFYSAYSSPLIIDQFYPAYAKISDLQTACYIVIRYDLFSVILTVLAIQASDLQNPHHFIMQ